MSNRAKGLTVGSALLCLALAAATTSAALPRGCPHSAARPAPGDRQLLARATVCLLERLRARRGLPPLRFSPAAARVARLHARALVKDRSADLVGARPLLAQLRAHGWRAPAGSSQAAGEATAFATAGAATARMVLAALLRSPQHRKLLLERRFRAVGIAVAFSPPSGPGGGASWAIVLTTAAR